jgi:hypothetical protein
MGGSGVGQDAFFIRFKMKPKASKLPQITLDQMTHFEASTLWKTGVLGLNLLINRLSQLHARPSLGMKAPLAPHSHQPSVRPAGQQEPCSKKTGQDGLFGLSPGEQLDPVVRC